MSIEDGRFFFGSMSKLAIALRLEPEMDGWLGAYRVWLEGNHLGSPEEPMSIQPFWASLDGGTKRDESERARILQAARPSNEPDRARRSSTD